MQLHKDTFSGMETDVNEIRCGRVIYVWDRYLTTATALVRSRSVAEVSHGPYICA